MTKPTYKIETWTAAVKDHTITDEITNVYFKELLTDAVGHFTVSLPAEKGGDYQYDDVALNDVVKIWLTDGSLAADPHFVGRIGKITGYLTDSGYIRVLSGLSQGEVLLRRHKKNKFYDGVAASTIVTEWATDLGLGTSKIESDSTAVTLQVETKTYFDLLQWISDYWYDGGIHIKKDFWVDLSGDLVWANRDGTSPFRSGASVETLTVGDNIQSYNVDCLIDQVKNSVVIYGCAEAPLPRDKDSYTESLTNWIASVGTVDLSTADPKKGTYAIRGTNDATTYSKFKRTISTTTIRNLNTLYLWLWSMSTCTWAKLRIHAPDDSSYFETTLEKLSNDWKFNQLALGPNAVYDAVNNPNGIWTETGSPNWWDMQALEFYSLFSIANDQYIEVDALYFYPDRWYGGVADNTSKNAYGQRDFEMTDDKLHSDDDCTKRATTLIYILNDPATQIAVTTEGNSNILVGDRLSMTIPAEGISAADYDVLSVEQFLAGNYKTKSVMVSTPYVRQELPLTATNVVAKIYKTVKSLTFRHHEPPPWI